MAMGIFSPTFRFWSAAAGGDVAPAGRGPEAGGPEKAGTALPLVAGMLGTACVLGALWAAHRWIGWRAAERRALVGVFDDAIAKLGALGAEATKAEFQMVGKTFEQIGQRAQRVGSPLGADAFALSTSMYLHVGAEHLRTFNACLSQARWNSPLGSARRAMRKSSSDNCFALGLMMERCGDVLRLRAENNPALAVIWEGKVRYHYEIASRYFMRLDNDWIRVASLNRLKGKLSLLGAQAAKDALLFKTTTSVC